MWVVEVREGGNVKRGMEGERGGRKGREKVERERENVFHGGESERERGTGSEGRREGEGR